MPGGNLKEELELILDVNEKSVIVLEEGHFSFSVVVGYDQVAHEQYHCLIVISLLSWIRVVIQESVILPEFLDEPPGCCSGQVPSFRPKIASMLLPLSRTEVRIRLFSSTGTCGSKEAMTTSFSDRYQRWHWNLWRPPPMQNPDQGAIMKAWKAWYHLLKKLLYNTSKCLRILRKRATRMPKIRFPRWNFIVIENWTSTRSHERYQILSWELFLPCKQFPALRD